MINYSKINIAAGNMAKENTDNQQLSNKTMGKQESTNTVPYYKLFSFADHLDYLLMLIGTISAVGSGISIPLMIIALGNIIDSFGRTVNTKDIVHEVSKVFCNKNLIIVIYICRKSMLNSEI